MIKALQTFLIFSLVLVMACDQGVKRKVHCESCDVSWEASKNYLRWEGRCPDCGGKLLPGLGTPPRRQKETLVFEAEDDNGNPIKVYLLENEVGK